MPKSYRELESKNKMYDVVIYILLAFILVVFTFVAIINDQIEADFTAYEDKISKLEAKNEVLYKELKDIEMSGTCLQRIPAFEK